MKHSEFFVLILWYLITFTETAVNDYLGSQGKQMDVLSRGSGYTLNAFSNLLMRLFYSGPFCAILFYSQVFRYFQHTLRTHKIRCIS